MLTAECGSFIVRLMARPLRLDRAGLWCHVISRGNQRKPIYWDDRDRAHFIELFAGWGELFRLHLNPVRIHRMGLGKKQQGARRRGMAGFRERRGDWGREVALYLGREKGGMGLRALREAAGGRNVMAISLAIRRFRSRLSREKPLGKTVAQAHKPQKKWKSELVVFNV